MSTPDVSVNLSGVNLQNPVITASGTFGHGYEMSRWYDLNCLGAISLKSITKEERFGNPTPRIAETTSGLLNAVGLQNPGLQVTLAEEVPKLRRLYSGPLLANISGFSIQEYVDVSAACDEDPNIDILEINISCPNVQHGGMAFGTNAKTAAEVTQAVKQVAKKPVYIKLSPNVGNIAEIALACQQAGADGLVAINTLMGLRLNPRTGKPIVSIGSCGVSGPAILPIALQKVYEICSQVSIPVIGVGGIASADDVLEFISAGATAVQVGSQNLVDPFVCKKIIQDLPVQMEKYGFENLQQVRGRALLAKQ